MDYSWLAKKVADGSNVFINNMKMLVYKADSNIFSMLNFEDDNIFMEPLLYTYFNTKESKVSLLQILYGYIDTGKRPAELQVYADANGYIYLPGLGYYHTKFSDVVLTAATDKKTCTLNFYKDGVEAAHEFEPLLYAQGTTIEICRHNNPLLQTLFNKEEDLQIEDAVSRHTGHLNTAIGIIRKHYPEFYELFSVSVKKLFLYRSVHHRSFATMLANGVAFFNVKPGDDEVYLTEDITHQCGHVIYYPVLCDKQSFFNTDIHTPLNRYNHREDDTRTVLGAFYSLLPFCFSNTCSLRLYRHNVFSGRQLHEFIGRFAFRMTKFGVAIGDFRSGEMLTDKGKELAAAFDNTYQEIDNEVNSFLYQYDVSTQLYDFSYEKFLELNPFSLNKTA